MMLIDELSQTWHDASAMDRSKSGLKIGRTSKVVTAFDLQPWHLRLWVQVPRTLGLEAWGSWPRRSSKSFNFKSLIGCVHWQLDGASKTRWSWSTSTMGPAGQGNGHFSANFLEPFLIMLWALHPGTRWPSRCWKEKLGSLESLVPWLCLVTTWKLTLKTMKHESGNETWVQRWYMSPTMMKYDEILFQWWYNESNDT